MLYRSIEFQLTLPMGNIKYWGSFSQQRGVELTFKKAILKGCYVLTLQAFNDYLTRRPESKWQVVSLMGETIDVTCTLLTIGEAPPNKVHISPKSLETLLYYTVLLCGWKFSRHKNS